MWATQVVVILTAGFYLSVCENINDQNSRLIDSLIIPQESKLNPDEKRDLVHIDALDPLSEEDSLSKSDPYPLATRIKQTWNQLRNSGGTGELQCPECVLFCTASKCHRKDNSGLCQ